MGRFYRLSVLFVTLFLLAIAKPPLVLAKSYSIPADHFEALINPDGSVDVIEQLTYQFDGTFTWAEMWIPTDITRQNYTYHTTIENFAIQSTDQSPVQVETANQNGDQFYAKWLYSARDENKTFIVSYTITNAVVKHPDTAELYWQFIGDQWQTLRAVP